MKLKVILCVITAIVFFALGGFVGYRIALRSVDKKVEAAVAQEIEKQKEEFSKSSEAETSLNNKTDVKDTSQAETAKEEKENAETPIPAKEAETEEIKENEPVRSPASEKLFNISLSLRDMLPEANGSWSIYLGDIKEGAFEEIGDHSMQAASLIKLYIMGAVYERYDEMVANNGAEMIDSNLYYMITISDNDSANNLVGALGYGDTAAGMSVVNQFCAEHGFNETSMGRLLLQSNENGDNYTSVKDCGEFMIRVYRGAMGIEGETFAYADQMFSLLNQQQRRNKIPSLLPDDTLVANKTGELDDVENDAGIIFNTPSGTDIVVVFMSENLQDCGDAQNTIGALTRYIYDNYNS